jgi:hypothetical protein
MVVAVLSPEVYVEVGGHRRLALAQNGWVSHPHMDQLEFGSPKQATCGGSSQVLVRLSSSGARSRSRAGAGVARA